MKKLALLWNFAGPIWALGFRPFFLLGGISSVLLMGQWILFQRGHLPLLPYFPPALWHAHEMIFGFALGIVAGFILTATQNWAGIPGVKGQPLFTLVVLWLAGRLGLSIWTEPSWIYAIVDLAFVPYLGKLLWPYLSKPDQKRNRIFYFFFTLMFVGNALIHLDSLGVLTNTAPSGLRLGVYAILLVILVIGGRVLPFFTKKAIPNAQVKSSPLIEKLVIPATSVFAILDSLFIGELWLWPLAAVLFLLHGCRWFFWGPWQSRTKPILWVLYLGYLWIPLGFALHCFASLGWVMPSLAIHALTAGGFGILILGMITRVSLGHTGRPLQAKPVIVLSYVLLNLGTVLRVLWPLVQPSQYATAITASGILWTLAFAIFVLVYAPILLKPRIDGRPG